MSDLPELQRADADRPPTKKLASILDDALLVVGAVVVALVVLKTLSIIAGTIFFMIKVAAVAGLIYVVLRVLRSRSR